MKVSRAAVFLDRDGVLIEDRGLLIDPAGISILPGVPAALRKLKAAGFFLAVVSNQAVVARGLITLGELEALNGRIRSLLEAAGARRWMRPTSVRTTPTPTCPSIAWSANVASRGRGRSYGPPASTASTWRRVSWWGTA